MAGAGRRETPVAETVIIGALLPGFSRMEPREFEIMRETYIARAPREVGSVTPLMDKIRDLFELKAIFFGK